jgi:anti-sigma regulatory factor (Ser/Thr protein kinase)
VIKDLQNRLLAQRSMEERELLRIGMALHEALLNAIYHGNLELDSELRQDDERRFYNLAETRRHQAPYHSRQVVVQMVLTQQSATFVIRDDGPGFDVSAVPDPTEGDNVFRVGGRGLLMIRSFMDKVIHNRRGNKITMIKELPSPAASPFAGDLRIQGRSNSETVAGIKVLL